MLVASLGHLQVVTSDFSTPSTLETNWNYLKNDIIIISSNPGIFI